MLPPFSRQLSVHIISQTLHCSDILVVCGVQPEELALPPAEELALPAEELALPPAEELALPPAEELSLPPEESAYDREVGTVERQRNYMDPK